MPKYELMYIIGSQTSDDQIPAVMEEIKKIIEKDGGLIEKHEEPGKKKLAYPIKKTKTGYYIVTQFSAPAELANDIERRIRDSQNVIRHLMLNIDEGLIRMEKDRQAQAKMKVSRARAEARAETPVRTEKPSGKLKKKIEIDLDAEIEKALESPEDIK